MMILTQILLPTTTILARNDRAAAPVTFSCRQLRADVSKYRPEVYKTQKLKILKKIHKVALGKLLTYINVIFTSIQ